MKNFFLWGKKIFVEKNVFFFIIIISISTNIIISLALDINTHLTHHLSTTTNPVHPMARGGRGVRGGGMGSRIICAMSHWHVPMSP